MRTFSEAYGRIFLVILVLGLFIEGCGSNDSNNDDGPKAPIGNIKIDNNIRTIHRNYLSQAVDYLDSLSYWPSQNDLAQITGLEKISSATLHHWLDNRVQYILASTFDAFSINSGFYVNQPFDFENPGILPDIESGTRLADFHSMADTAQIHLLMQNLGATLYYTGKFQKKLIGLNIPGSGTVILSTPLVGVIQLGDGLFPKGPARPPVSVYSIFLLGTLFHEAHHSNGNGRSLGFFHTVCPKNHRYEGYLACDRNLNGPYKLEAIFLKTLIGSCSQCSAKQIEDLKGMVNDNLSRELPASTVNGVLMPSTVWDITPEGHR